MIRHEYEVVAHAQLEQLNLFVVEMGYRAPHLHDDLELGLLLSGKVTLNAPKESVRLEAGDIYLLNPRQAHEFLTDGQSAHVLAVQLTASLLRQLYPGQPIWFEAISVRDRITAGDHALLKALLLMLAQCYLRREAGYPARCLSLLTAIACRLESAIPYRAIPDAEMAVMEQRSYRIYRLMKTVEQNFHSKLLLSDIARQENLSMPYLSHFFRDVMHMTFQEYLNKTRFEYACMLLRTTAKSVTEISELSGFSDVRYLNRMYKAAYGITPKEAGCPAAAAVSGVRCSVSLPLGKASICWKKHGFLPAVPFRDIQCLIFSAEKAEFSAPTGPPCPFGFCWAACILR